MHVSHLPDSLETEDEHEFCFCRDQLLLSCAVSEP